MSPESAKGNRFLARLPTPLRLAVLTIAVLALGLYQLTSYISREADSLMAQRTVSGLTAELELLRRALDAGGLKALIDRIDQRAIANTETLYYLESADHSRLAGNLERAPLPEARGRPYFSYSLAAPSATKRRLSAGVLVPAGDSANLYVLRDIDDISTFTSRIKKAALIATGLLAALGVAGGLFLSSLLNRRITTITNASSAFMSGDLTRRIPRDQIGDELDTLAQNLNAMLTRIEELMSALREVSDNIAHDLKTPLTRLRNRAEAALRDPSGADAYRAGLEHTLEEADGLIKTFNALLLIARLEAGAVDETKTITDVTALAEDVAELYGPVAEEADLALQADIAPGLTANINRQLVGQAIANMVDNAIKYARGTSDPGAIILAASQNTSGAIAISVSDRGPGIPAHDRARVLKRFVRLEQSRSRPGTGLGLSLVAAVARLHNGTVALEDNAPGLRIVLTLAPPKIPVARSITVTDEAPTGLTTTAEV